MYEDGVGLAAQAESFGKVADILNEDLARIQKYFKSWFLTLNSNNTTSIVFNEQQRC